MFIVTHIGIKPIRLQARMCVFKQYILSLQPIEEWVNEIL